MTRLLNLLVIPFLLSGCTPKRDAVPVIWSNTKENAFVSALAKSQSIGGKFLEIAPTGSMEPFITGGDFIVVDTKVPYGNIKQGWMALYQARWLPKESSPVCHWVADKQGDEWIMDGQANSHYESGKAYRMGKEEWLGRVILIVKVRK